MLKEAGRLTNAEFERIIRNNEDMDNFDKIRNHFDGNCDYYVDDVLERFPLAEQLELRHCRRQIAYMADDYDKYNDRCFKLVANVYRKRVIDIVQTFINHGIIDFNQANSILSWYLKYYYKMGRFGKYMPLDLSYLVQDRTK